MTRFALLATCCAVANRSASCNRNPVARKLLRKKDTFKVVQPASATPLPAFPRFMEFATGVWNSYSIRVNGIPVIPLVRSADV